ncbi:hypothetical protein [Brevibacterium linens]|uniref:hypothetical protein n=1 Tax=Brevibacterium linens TaxID=1703 RepID=UPI003BF55621
MNLGPDVFTAAPPLAIGIALIIAAGGWALVQYGKAAAARARAKNIDDLKSEHDADLAQLKGEVADLRAEIKRLRADYDGEIRRLQNLLLEEQREAFRLRGLLAAAGIED